MLEGVFGPGGTASGAGIEGYVLAGKTGTAEKPDEYGGYSKTKFVSSFVGFAPARRPKLLVAVMVDEPQGDIYGGTVAAPAFREITSFALQYLRIAPQTLNHDSILGVPYRPTERTRARLAAARERIVDAALAQLAEGGYASASVVAVARRAGRGDRQRLPPLPVQGRPVRRGVPPRVAARGRRPALDDRPRRAGRRTGWRPGWRRSCAARWPSRCAPTR